MSDPKWSLNFSFCSMGFQLKPSWGVDKESNYIIYTVSWLLMTINFCWRKG